VTPGRRERADVGITSGRIAQLGATEIDATEIDAGGLLVIPGGIDAHVHLMCAPFTAQMAALEPGEPPGHLWRWELEPIGTSRTRVTQTYDWTQLTDKKRLPRARATTSDKLRASLDRLAALAEQS
jgi:cytosine/adenosine deaminase-related metal-dependent hydrolase